MKRALLLVFLFLFLCSACAGGGDPPAGAPGDPARPGQEAAASAPRLAEDGRIILTIGAFQRCGAQDDLLSYTHLKKAVDRFNAQNREYVAEIRNYGDAAGADALYQLNAEILAGDMPDMLATSEMPVHSYAGKGLLLDLYEWYDPSAFFAGPLRSMETEGRLYSVSSSIQVVSFFALESVLGKAEGYSLEDIYRAWEGFYTGENAFICQFNGTYAFLILAGLRLNDWVDLTAGTCRFDTPEFISLLEFCHKLPAEAVITESEAYAQGKLNYTQTCALGVKNRDSLLMPLFLNGGVGSVLGEFAAELTPLEGESIVNVGIPGTLPASAGCAGELPIAVSARCAAPEGAKQFLDSLWDLRYLQLYEGEMRSIPLMRSVLEEYIDACRAVSGRTFTDENGEAYTAIDFGRNSMPGTDALIEGYLALIDSAAVPTSVSAASMSSVDLIIAEEALAYFSDTQTAEKTAQNIQTRYSLFLEEQR